MRGLVAGLLTFVAYLIVQAVVFHSLKVSRRALVLVGFWIAGLPLYEMIYHMLPDDKDIWLTPFVAPSDLLTYLNGGLFYFFLFTGYAPFFYTAESSVGVRTMIELASELEKGLTLEELTQRYGYDWMLDRRLRRLIHAGYLIEEDGWYRTTVRGRLAAAVLSRCKRLLRLGPGG